MAAQGARTILLEDLPATSDAFGSHEPVARAIADMVRAETGGKAIARDIEDLAYKFYRSHWTQLPKFDQIKHEREGKLPAGLFDISPASRNADFGGQRPRAQRGDRVREGAHQSR